MTKALKCIQKEKSLEYPGRSKDRAESALWWEILTFKNEKNKIQGTPVGKKLKSLYSNLYLKKEWKIHVKTKAVNTQLIVLTCNVYALKHFRMNIHSN